MFVQYSIWFNTKHLYLAWFLLVGWGDRDKISIFPQSHFHLEIFGKPQTFPQRIFQIEKKKEERRRRRDAIAERRRRQREREREREREEEEEEKERRQEREKKRKNQSEQKKTIEKKAAMGRRKLPARAGDREKYNSGHHVVAFYGNGTEDRAAMTAGAGTNTGEKASSEISRGQASHSQPEEETNKEKHQQQQQRLVPATNSIENQHQNNRIAETTAFNGAIPSGGEKEKPPTREEPSFSPARASDPREPIDPRCAPVHNNNTTTTTTTAKSSSSGAHQLHASHQMQDQWHAAAREVPRDPREIPRDPRELPRDPREIPRDPRELPRDPRLGGGQPSSSSSLHEIGNGGGMRIGIGSGMIGINASVSGAAPDGAGCETVPQDPRLQAQQAPFERRTMMDEGMARMNRMNQTPLGRGRGRGRGRGIFKKQNYRMKRRGYENSSYRPHFLKGPYGNYHNYYERRHESGNIFACDPRMKVIQRGMIEGKVCLDIGCNEGVIGLELAMEYFSKRFVGVDIDEELIEKANGNLQYRIRSLEDGSPGRAAMRDRKLHALGGCEFIAFDIRFMDLDSNAYDTVLCLSTTKWIHLYYGDEGIIDLFKIFKQVLKPGGHLVLEFQGWSSYTQARKKRELEPFFREKKLKQPADLQIHPEAFRNILQNEYGFTMVKEEDTAAQTSYKNRMIHIYRKN